MENEIKYKITQLLEKCMPINEEAHVVYLLVEIRKMLDILNSGSYPTLRFYCDWSVHTKKSRITPTIQSIMDEIYKEILTRKNFLDNPADRKTAIIPAEARFSFAYMTELKKEMKGFFISNNFSEDLFETKNWTYFVNTLIKVLADQEIENPCDGIRSCKYTNQSKLIFIYKTKEAEYDSYELDTIS